MTTFKCCIQRLFFFDIFVQNVGFLFGLVSCVGIQHYGMWITLST